MDASYSSLKEGKAATDLREANPMSKVTFLEEPPSESSAMLAPEKSEISNLTRSTRSALLRLSTSSYKSSMGKMMVSEMEGKSQVDISRENISRKLLELLEEDADQFEDFDLNEVMPSSPFKEASFGKLQQFFETIIAEINVAHHMGIPLDEVKEEFQFLWKGIQKSHNSLNAFLEEDLELTAKVTDTMAKTKHLIKIAENDPETSERLGHRLVTAWGLLDVSEAEDRKNGRKIAELQTDIMILNRNIQAAAHLEGHSALTELQQIRKGLQDGRDKLIKEFGQLTTSRAMFIERRRRLAEKRAEYENIIWLCNEEVQAEKEAAQREEDRLVSIQDEIELLSEKIEKETKELHDIEQYSSGSTLRIRELERTISAQKVINESCAKEVEAVVTKRDKVRTDHDGQAVRVENLAMDTFKKQNELKQTELEIIRMGVEGRKASRELKMQNNRCVVLQERLNKLEGDRKDLQLKVMDLENELVEAQKQLEGNRKKVKNLDRTRTVVNRNFTRAKVLADEHNNQLAVQVIAQSNLKREMEVYKLEIQVQAGVVERLESERDYYSQEGIKLAFGLKRRIAEVKKMDTLVFQFRKTINDLEGTVRTKLQDYEKSLIERRFYENVLRETGSKISSGLTEVRNNTFELNTEIFSYFNEQTRFGKQKALLEYIFTEKRFFTMEADRMRKMAVDMGREVDALESERSALGKGRAQAESELSRQRHYAMQAESRMRSYNQRMQRTEEELEKIWENFRSLHSMVRIGARHFRNLMAEIRSTRQGIVNLRRLSNKVKGNLNHIVALQAEISVLSGSIAKETCMVNALEDELSRPVNVHRWRALEAIDPNAYEAVMKLNIVTKRLIDLNETLRKQSLRIEDKENICIDLHHAIRRLSSIETPELRQHYQVILNDKRELLNRLRLEFQAAESKVKFYRKEVAGLNSRLKELKKWYIRDAMEHWLYTQDPENYNGGCGDDRYENHVRGIDVDYPLTKINFKNQDIASLRESFKTHQLQQEAIEKCFSWKKTKVLKRRKDPDYDEYDEDFDIYCEKHFCNDEEGFDWKDSPYLDQTQYAAWRESNEQNRGRNSWKGYECSVGFCPGDTGDSEKSNKSPSDGSSFLMTSGKGESSDERRSATRSREQKAR